MSEITKNQKSVDLQRMIDTAMAFFLAGERCSPEFSFGRYPSHSLTAPVVVAYALAVEIALKILNRHYGLPADGHDLMRLLETLPDETRIHLQYLEDEIQAIKSTFVEWRYPYEYEFLSVNPSSIRRAFILLHREIRRVLPNLESIYEKNWGHFDPDWYWAWPDLEIAQIEERLGPA